MLAVQLQTLWWSVKDRFVGDEGATMPEYALMVALIALVAMVGAFALGGAVNTELGDAGNVISNNNPGP